MWARGCTANKNVAGDCRYVPGRTESFDQLGWSCIWTRRVRWVRRQVALSATSAATPTCRQQRHLLEKTNVYPPNVTHAGVGWAVLSAGITRAAASFANYARGKFSGNGLASLETHLALAGRTDCAAGSYGSNNGAVADSVGDQRCRRLSNLLSRNTSARAARHNELAKSTPRRSASGRGEMARSRWNT